MGIGLLALLLNSETLVDMDSCCLQIRYVQFIMQAPIDFESTSFIDNYAWNLGRILDYIDYLFIDNSKWRRNGSSCSVFCGKSSRQST